MNLDQLFILVERLRKEAIGEPKWINKKRVYEYQDHSAKVVAVLKVTRAAQGVKTLDLLCRSLDLEKFPNTSSNVDKFVKSFFESTIDGYLSNETPPVPTKKIRSAMVRVLKGSQDEETRTAADNIYNTFCGYVHASYAHIMESYNGCTFDFNLS
jgi:hypothetical protein